MPVISDAAEEKNLFAMVAGNSPLLGFVDAQSPAAIDDEHIPQ